MKKKKRNSPLAKKLKSVRKARGLSKTKLAALIHVSPETLRRIEEGHHFHAATALKIIYWLKDIRST